MEKPYFPEKNRGQLSLESGGGVNFLALVLLEAFCVTLSKSWDVSRNWVLSFTEGMSWDQVLLAVAVMGRAPPALSSLVLCFRLSCTGARQGVNAGPVA